MMTLPTLDDVAIQRFWSKVDKPEGLDECWRWTGKRNKKGYGRFSHLDVNYLAHRIAYLLAHSDPGELCVCHRCDNCWCVNPSCLWLGTRADNNKDKANKGRAVSPLKLNPGLAARGERSSYRLHPESFPRGEESVLSKLKEAQVIEIRKRCAAGETLISVSRDFPVSPTTIRKIAKRRLWAHIL